MENRANLYRKISQYLHSNYIETQLYNRYRNSEEEYFNMNVKDLQNVLTLDEYFYKSMEENEYNRIGSPLNKYLTIISRQLESQPLLLISLPMWKLDKNKLRTYLPNYDNIVRRINQIQSDVNNIFRKFEISPYRITDEELQKMVIFFSYTIPYANERMLRAQEILAKHLLNNPKDRNSLHNYNIATFLIKFFGYKKIKEEKLENTKIIIGNLSPGTYGESSDNYAIVNKTLLQKVLIENNTLDDKFGHKTIYRNSQHGYPISQTYHEMLGIMHTLYHELRHQKQKNHSNSHKIDDLSYYYASFEIINETGGYDYNTNYKCYEIEKDANYKAWEDVEKLIKTYMPNQNTERLMKNVLNHKLKEELEQITGMRKTYDNRTYISNDLLMKYLDDKFRTNSYLVTQKYKQFLNFYNYNGTPKRAIELLTQPLIYQYKDFYFGQVSYRSRILGYKLTTNDISRLQIKEIQAVINNIKILMNINKEKLNKICDRVKKYNENSQEVIGNIVNYHRFAIYLSNIMNEILILHPNLRNILSIRNAIDSINANIDMINHNSIVLKNINSSNRISRVGRR